MTLSPARPAAEPIQGVVDGVPFLGYVVPSVVMLGEGHPRGRWVRKRKPLPSSVRQDVEVRASA